MSRGNGRSFAVALIDRDTAPLLPPLLRRVFGETYTDASLYTAEGVELAVANDSSLFFVVIDVEERSAAGLLAMRFSFPCPRLAELGMLIVDPALGPGASGKVLQMLGEALATKARELARAGRLLGLTSTEVTVHTKTQRLVEQFGFVTTGMYLGWIPAWAERLQGPACERAAVRGAESRPTFDLRRAETVSVLPFVKLISPYRVALPTRFAALLTEIYRRTGLPAEIVAAEPLAGRCALAEQVEARDSLAVLELTRVGLDAASTLLGRLDHYRRQGIELVHVAIPLTAAGVDPIVEPLIAAGFRYAALIPHYRDQDVLMLQHIGDMPLNVKASDLAAPFTRRLFAEAVAPETAGEAE